MRSHSIYTIMRTISRVIKDAFNYFPQHLHIWKTIAIFNCP
jgi:hypothetical protein